MMILILDGTSNLSGKRLLIFGQVLGRMTDIKQAVRILLQILKYGKALMI